MSARFKEDWTEICAANPWAKDALLPRRYVSNDQYHSPVEAAVVLSALFQEMAHGSSEFIEESHLTMAYLVKAEMPTYFVSEALLDAARATTIPPTFQLAHINWPLPAVLFILPKGKLRVDERDVSFIAISRNLSHPRETFHPELPAVAIAGDSLTWMADSPARRFWGMIRPGEPLMDTLNNLDLEWNGVLVPAADRTPVDRILPALTVKLLLMMSVRKEGLVGKGTCVRPEQTKGGKKKDALWSPNILGRDYKVRNEAEPSGTATASGRSKRLHWTRGHLRQQPYGPRETPRYEAIWIEPFISGSA